MDLLCFVDLTIPLETMKIVLVFVIFNVFGNLAGEKRKADLYADIVLKYHLPLTIREQNLDPAKLDNFSFKINRTRITNRQIQANFTNGSLIGLPSHVRRFGPCNVSTVKEYQNYVTCKVYLDGLQVEYDGTAKGDNIFSTIKHFKGKAVVVNTTALIEFISYATGGPAFLQGFRIDGVNLNIQPFKNLDLNHKRMKAFFEEFRKAASSRVLQVLRDPVKAALVKTFINAPSAKS